MAAYGAGPKTEAAKELLVREVSCCFICRLDLAAAFDEFYGAALGMSAVPAAARRAGHVAYPENWSRAPRNGIAVELAAGGRRELDAETAALCARRKQPPPASIRHLAAVENRPSKLTTAMRWPSPRPRATTSGPGPLPPRWPSPSCTPAAKNELFLLAAELARGARIVTARYDAPFDRDDLDLKERRALESNARSPDVPLSTSCAPSRS